MTGDLRKSSTIRLEAHQGRVISCGWCSKKGLLATSGNDGTVRVWNVTKNQYTLQQTCVFNRSDGSPEESGGGLGSPGEPGLAPVAWSMSGRFLAAAMEKVINIWQVNGGKGLLDLQPHWVSALSWPENEPGCLWAGEPREVLLVGRMDGTLGLIEVLDASNMQRTELQHCYRKDGTETPNQHNTVLSEWTGDRVDGTSRPLSLLPIVCQHRCMVGNGVQV
uniref:Uncharacterized protein n=1 Tax=Astyanax mexicanus TaxID=7994 RepID=A0A3B1IF13_ASTMX